MMKDYLAYTLMNRMGVPTPLCSFVQLSVNGEPWGLYLAVEGVDDELLEIGGAVLVDAEIHGDVAGFYQGDSPPCARRREILRI